MRLAPTPIISEHRFARLLRWASLFASGAAAAILAMLGNKNPRRALDRLARVVAMLIFVGAAARVVGPRKHGTCRHGGAQQRGALRALIGQGARRVLRGRDVFARLGAIFSALLRIERHIARMASRLRHGLTRRRAWRVRASEDAPARALIIAAQAFDSS